MDKNTITGLVLIAIVLVVFSFLSRPTQAQQEAMQKYYDSIALVQKKEAELQVKQQQALAQQTEQIKSDSSALFYEATKGEDRLVELKNGLFKINISTKGGRLFSGILNDYFEQDQKTPITIFNKENASMNFMFYNQKQIIQTKDLYFTPVAQTDSSVVMRLYADSTSYIDFNYAIHENSYMVDFSIQATNMADKLANTSYVDIECDYKARQLEKGYKYENRLAELTYRTSLGKIDNLSNAKDEEQKLEGEQQWIAFKNQFFSTVLIADKNFSNTTVSSKIDPEGSGYIKTYKAEMRTAFDPYGKKETKMEFYVGPNKYKELAALDKGREKELKLNRLVYLGWPVVRQINKWFIINIFDWLRGWGLNMGIVLLILTIIVKAVVFPTTWKTFKSSAKMRVLKPKIDELNKKYPNKEDAMQKQQEMMMLYKQYGANPMGGCLPMLLQFPVLMAMFMFVPSAIEFRQQHFLWSNDLSTYDALINFPFHVPFIGDHLSMFCLLMTITSILNARLTMKQQDNGSNPNMAAMKWMQYLMPVMFLFILNDYPAGLNYYYFISMLISVATMVAFRRMTNDEELLAKMEANKKDMKNIKLSGFAARLQQMQKMQEERAKQMKK